MRVLVVDDELTSRVVLAGIVSRLGHEPVVVNDGRAAWDEHSRAPFPLVLTDWLMPEMSGLELAQRVRTAAREGDSKPAEGYTFVLAVTALSERERALEAFEAGVDDVVAKPIDAERLRAHLAVATRILTGHAATREEGMRAAVSELQAAVGPHDPRLLEGLGALVDLYRSQDARAKARAFLRREIEISRRAFGDADPRVAALRAQLGELKELDGVRLH